MKYNYELSLQDCKKANKEYFCKYFLMFVIFSIIGFITIITLIISGVLSETILRKIKVLVIILTTFFIWSVVFVFHYFKSIKIFKEKYKDISIIGYEVNFDNGEIKILNTSSNNQKEFFKKKYIVKQLKNYYVVFVCGKESIIIDKTEESEKLIRSIYIYNSQKNKR